MLSQNVNKLPITSIHLCYIVTKHNVYYTGAVTECQQTSDNFHTPMLHRHKKNYCINEELS